MKVLNGLSAIAVLTSLYLLFWLLLSGNVRPDEVSLGVIASLILAFFTRDIVFKGRPELNLRRLIEGMKYVAYYFTVAEYLAHKDVIYRILHPRMPINPGIVKVPCTCKTDFGLTAVACSITNTPGTVSVETDTGRGVIYVNWINVTSMDLKACYESINKAFDEKLLKVFG
ncbi:MAG: Na+/H+ antiporter subunit E [Candidatus Nezhaarchaeales archaeon]